MRGRKTLKIYLGTRKAQNMTVGLMIKIAVVIAITAFIIARRGNNKSKVCADMERVRTSDWGGWIEIANSDHAPLFQGRIVATSQEYAGALLFGALVEENAPEPLVRAIKAGGSCAYLKKGLMLVRGLTAHDNKLIMTRLMDTNLMDGLCAAEDQGAKPAVCLVLNSIEIQHMDTPEGMAQFETMWEDAFHPGVAAQSTGVRDSDAPLL